MTQKIALIYGTFHQKEAQIMLEEARAAASEKKLEIACEIGVPGSLEVPLVLKKILEKRDIDCAAVLGVIERGETKHGLTMGQAVVDAVIKLQLEHNKPVGWGIIGPEVMPTQIPPRLKSHARSAVLAAATILNLPIWENSQP